MNKIIGLFICLFAGSASAMPMFYTDRADFLSAAGAVNLETFESEPVGFQSQSYTTASGLVFSTSGSTTNEVRNAPGTFGTSNTTPGGSRFLESDSTIPSFHDPVVFSHTGGTLNSWGAFFTDADFGSIEFLVDGLSVASPNPGANAGVQFFGFVGPINFLEIQLTTNDRTWGVDDVYWSLESVSVSEPGAFALLGLGLVAFGLARKKKSA